jgi:hypothetical protein
VAHVPVDGRDGVPDVCVIELGGTVGDIESMPFIEALRQFQFRVGPQNMAVVHVSLVPVLGVVGEQKTKPTQHSVQVGQLAAQRRRAVRARLPLLPLPLPLLLAPPPDSCRRSCLPAAPPPARACPPRPDCLPAARCRRCALWA